MELTDVDVRRVKTAIDVHSSMVRTMRGAEIARMIVLDVRNQPIGTVGCDENGDSVFREGIWKSADSQ